MYFTRNQHIFAVSLSFCTILCFCYVEAGPLSLTILHTNDIQSHFQEFNANWDDCTADESREGRCYGGWARRDTKIKQIRQEINQLGGNVLLLDAGNQFGATLWFTVYKDEATSYFMNRTGYDGMAIGNHEFDNKPEGLALFLKDAAFPVVSSNLDDSKEPVIKNLYQKSHVFELGAEKVAVIGYTYWNTGEIAPAGDIVFHKEEESIRQEVNRLTKEGINKIIALGHSGIVVDERIAKQVEGVDLIVGGDEQFFFYTGKPPSDDDVPKYDYPFRVTPDHDPNAVVPVFQAYRYGKYLGRFDVKFDSNGEVTQWSGNPILLDKDVQQDPETLAEIDKWAQKVEEYKMQYVGTTMVVLDGDRETCRRRECNLGDMIADAYIQQHLQVPNEQRWNDVSISLMNAGGIRESIQPGDILASDVNKVFPYGSTIDTLDLEGKYLLQALEKSVSEYEEILHGRFLHFSGLQVIYDLAKPVGQRVFSVSVLCTECLVPVYERIDPKKMYRILTTNFIAGGGDGYDMIAEHKRNHETGPLDVLVVSAYMRQFSPLHPPLDERLRFYEDGMDCSASAAFLSPSHAFVAIIISIGYLIISR